jgi:hypothetical protein
MLTAITGRIDDPDAAAAPYRLWYAGGEICPAENAEGRLVNHIHNFSFAACVLQGGGSSGPGA